MTPERPQSPGMAKDQDWLYTSRGEPIALEWQGQLYSRAGIYVGHYLPAHGIFVDPTAATRASSRARIGWWLTKPLRIVRPTSGCPVRSGPSAQPDRLARWGRPCDLNRP